MPKDELSAWLGGLGAYGKGKDTKELAFWLASHGCRSHRVNRKGGGGMKKVIFAATPAVSVCGGIQPGMLRKILTENKHFFDSGFIARILFAMPPDQSQRWTYDVVSDNTRNQYRELINGIRSWRFGNNANSLNPEEPDIITLSKSAEMMFADLCNANGEEREQMESDAQKAFFPKLTGYAARIALVFQLVKWWKNDTADYNIVDGETMESAIQLSQWFKREALRINEAIRGETAQVDLEASEILRVIRQKGEATVREIVQSGQAFRGEGGTERATVKVDTMVQKGLLIAEVRKAGNGVMVKYYSLPNADYANAIPNFLEDDVVGVDGSEDETFETAKTEATVWDLPDEVEEWLAEMALEMALVEEPVVSLPDEVEAWLAKMSTEPM